MLLAWLATVYVGRRLLLPGSRNRAGRARPLHSVVSNLAAVSGREGHKDGKLSETNPIGLV